jgi:hypothetical protein
VNASGPVRSDPDPNQATLVAIVRQNNVEMLHSVTNQISLSFGMHKFQDALIDWVASHNPSLRVIKTPTFRPMIKAANPIAEAVFWRNHQSLRDAIIAKYHSSIPVVTAYMRDARSPIHVSFHN